MEGHYRGAAGRGGSADLTLERPLIYEFEGALVSIGLSKADATRLAATTGRSWSILRRRRSMNPAIRRPAWLGIPQADALSTLCLLGGWSDDKAADREIVPHVSGRTYEEVERAMRYLARALMRKDEDEARATNIPDGSRSLGGDRSLLCDVPGVVRRCRRTRVHGIRRRCCRSVRRSRDLHLQCLGAGASRGWDRVESGWLGVRANEAQPCIA